MAEGYIYVMFSPELPHCLKIGQTTREPSVRAKELSGTSTPVPFRILMQWRVSDVVAAELAAHNALREKRTASNREFFHIAGPEAIDQVGAAITPYLLSKLDDSLLKQITNACDEIALKYFSRDIRTEPPTPTDSDLVRELSHELRTMAENAAIRLVADSNDPRTILSAINLVDCYFEGPIHINNSPQSLSFLFGHSVGLLTYMMNPDSLINVGSDYVLPSVFNIIANISRTASNVMDQENKAINLDANP